MTKDRCNDRDKDFCDLLKRYPRAIVHLRSQVRKQRFGAILGAGISVDFGAPQWNNLINDIASDPAVDATDIVGGKTFTSMAAPYQTEILYQKFRGKFYENLTGLSPAEQLNSATAEWLTICQKYLYKTPPIDIAEALPKHPYMEELIPLIQNSALTINFNFDDYLERALVIRKRPIDKGNRGFEVVTDPWPQFRRQDCVIYHIHGYVPEGLMEKTVDRFVFSEASYSKQYVGSRGHDSSFFLAHLARNTCLLIGCSLEAELRNVLMRGAETNPGNFHYYCHWVPRHDALSDVEKQLISDTNFKVYNIITLFLTSSEIRLLLKLINGNDILDGRLNDLATRSATPLKYTFYMTGSLGVGKSTTTSHLRNLNVLDEWLEPRPEVLGKPWDDLTENEKVSADSWVAGQFTQKNDTLRHEKHPVISVVDRPPLDPLVFTLPVERSAKAKFLADHICPNDGLGSYGIEKGVVILLLGDPKELSARVRATGRSKYTAERLEDMQQQMRELYEPMQGTVTIDTQFMSIAELTKRVAEVIHREKYEPADLTTKLHSYLGDGSGSV
ncbi:SIR2 family protein [Pseudomonas rhizoryzae]|uniref:SIR2 family protein n=1 Tax=Pseudomonas rhizoryzae TaxID=2571129 RepID=UPI0009C09490|nr:SIR2 family protein [Pseudomonas rhizoryzae]